MPSSEEIKREGQERQAIVDALLIAFTNRVTRLERWLYEEFYDDFTGRVTVGKGDIRSNEGSIRKVNQSPVWKRFYQESRKIVDWILEEVVTLTNKIATYFDKVTGGDTMDGVRMSAQKMLNRMGYNGKDVLKGGYFDSLINDRTAERRVKRIAVQAIAAGKSIDDFKADLKLLLNIDRQAGRLGVVEAHYYTNANTVFAEFDRAVSFDQAKQYDLNHAIWSGPTLTTSRSFCKSKKGKVFSREQIEAMDNQTWVGKIPGQATVISAGGYNCVDILLWISAGMAGELGWIS